MDDISDGIGLRFVVRFQWVFQGALLTRKLELELLVGPAARGCAPGCIYASSLVRSSVGGH